MNTNKLKSYAPKARLAFMQAVTKRAAVLGLYKDRISEISIQGDNAIIEGRVFTRKQGEQRNQLVKRIKALGTHDKKLTLAEGFNQFINETAFTWFNRLTAIRYMEINDYLDHGFRVLSKGEHAKFEDGFEILSHAADVADDLGLDKTHIVQMMLDGDTDEELYREILLGQCHQLSTIMPFMFEKLDDATELLLPDNLTKTDSILKDLINELPEDNWRDFEQDKGQIEVIGWLYQFYISEHKDAVMGKVVKREDIPAATQLFTPNWIVKYLVQNSLGRQWLATYPDSELKDKMEYYITPAEQSDDVIEQLIAITPTSIDPETIKVLDPAVGSGHILVEVYEVLREIYLERGYRLREIPSLILTKNIYGLDIDDRAAQMAAFAVLMKAREDDKRIFSRIADNDIKLNIYSLQSTENLDINKLWTDLDLEAKQQSNVTEDLFAEPESEVAEVSNEHQVYLDLLHYLKTQFMDAKNLGSLIEIDSQYQNTLVELKDKLLEKVQSSYQPTREAVEVLLPIVDQAIVLVNRYDISVANPPYMNSKGMNITIKEYGKKNFNISKTDLFSMFMERAFHFLNVGGYNAQVNMQSWMFLTSFEKLREYIIESSTFITMAHLGSRAFGQISGEVVQTTAWVLQNNTLPNYQSTFFRLVDGGEEEKRKRLKDKVNPITSSVQADFRKIPGSPIAYWVNNSIRSLFTNNEAFDDRYKPRKGNDTGNNDLFLRYWHEVDFLKVGFNYANEEESASSLAKWFPYNKGGPFRKWFGNFFYVIDWENSGYRIRNYTDSKGNLRSNLRNQSYYFKEGVTWSDISSSSFAARYLPQGFMCDNSGSACYGESFLTKPALGFLGTPIAFELLKILNPTLHFQAGNISSLPLPYFDYEKVDKIVSLLINKTKFDWDMYETSWEFLRSPLEEINNNLRKVVNNHIQDNINIIEEVANLEMANNKIFIEALNLGDEFDACVHQNDITLNMNPFLKFSDVDFPLLKEQAEIIRNLISFFIGVFFGRYSLDREGLVYAHSGNNGFKELVAEGAYKTFPADDDGIIPLAAEEWLFEDDATTRFKEFVKTVWGAENLTENLDFVAESLCLDAIKMKKGEGAMETIRRYFATQFYKDHLKTYKKRPIYWLFSSGKEKAFECLVYLHRYNESTLARMRTEYITPLMGKFESQIAINTEKLATETSTSEKSRLSKLLKSIEKKQAELRTFDEELKYLAEMKISIDLDDGVKVNYGKFGNLLADVKAIHGKLPENLK